MTINGSLVSLVYALGKKRIYPFVHRSSPKRNMLGLCANVLPLIDTPVRVRVHTNGLADSLCSSRQDVLSPTLSYCVGYAQFMALSC